MFCLFFTNEKTVDICQKKQKIHTERETHTHIHIENGFTVEEKRKA